MRITKYRTTKGKKGKKGSSGKYRYSKSGISRISKSKKYSSKNGIVNIDDSYNKKKVILVSHYNDNINIFHIFVKEIMAIWKDTEGDINTIIILKNYINNGLNNWRLTLLKKLYKNVFVNEIPIYIDKKQYIIKNILEEKYNKWHSDPEKFRNYDKTNDDFTSLFEIMTTFNIVSDDPRYSYKSSHGKGQQGHQGHQGNQSANNNSYKVLYICNSTEQMVHSINFFLQSKFPNIKDYDYRIITPNIPNNNIGNINLVHNYNKLLLGLDNTGNITKIENIKWCLNYVKNLWLMSSNYKYLNLIVSDGVEFDMGIDNDNSNSVLIFQKQILAQAITTLACSSKGGSCCIKNYSYYKKFDKVTNIDESYEASGFFISILYLYYVSFNSVNLYKPQSNHLENGEFYIIGKGFKGIDNSQLDRLFNILSNFKVNNSIIPREYIPESFIKQINIFLKLMNEQNTTLIEQENLYLTCYKNKLESIVEKNKEKYKKTNKYLDCDTVLIKHKREQILIPKYKEWIKNYKYM